jgi:hypothetical protein
MRADSPGLILVERVDLPPVPGDLMSVGDPVALIDATPCLLRSRGAI